MIYLKNPLKWLVVTFPFGAEYPQTIKSKGLNYHMGVDFRTDGIKSVVSPIDGYISQVITDRLGGNIIRITSNESDGNIFLEVRFAHLSKIFKKEGDKVLVGDPIAMSGNTGEACIGHHLHMDLKKVIYSNGIRTKIIDYGNKFSGCIDPAPYMINTVGYCEWLNIDNKYGRKKNWLAEFIMRFKNFWIHKQLIKMGRKPDSLTQRELDALVYGGWAWYEVLDPSMFPIVATLKKSDYLLGKDPGIRLIR